MENLISIVRPNFKILFIFSQKLTIHGTLVVYHHNSTLEKMEHQIAMTMFEKIYQLIIYMEV